MIGYLLAGAAAAAPAESGRQVEIVREVAQALADDNEKVVARHFDRAAIFAGQQDYPWSFASFRATVLARDCTFRPAVWPSQAVAKAFDLTTAEIKNPKANVGPALVLYCVSDKRRAAHELYTFAFRGDKIARVTLFAVAPVPPRHPGLLLRPNRQFVRTLRVADFRRTKYAMPS